MGRRSRRSNVTRRPYPSHTGSACGRNYQGFCQPRWAEPRGAGSTPKGVGRVGRDDRRRDDGTKTLFIRSDHGKALRRRACSRALTKMNDSNLTTPETILDFWFGSTSDDTVVAKEQADLWWSKNKATDDEIRGRFEIYLILAVSEQLNDWLSTPRECL